MEWSFVVFLHFMQKNLDIVCFQNILFMAQSIQARLNTPRVVLLSLTMTHPGSPRLDSSSQPRFNAPPRSLYPDMRTHSRIECVRVCTYKMPYIHSPILRAVCNRWMTSDRLVIPTKRCWVFFFFFFFLTKNHTFSSSKSNWISENWKKV